ncbi:MAG: helical backbone metal receptor [Polyangiaceae bacterium]|nr:helical backbone metal receptor [Polyangiaceae bacterium]
MNRRGFVLAALAGAALAGCGRRDPTASEPGGAPAGSSLAEARRVVSVSPATTEALFAIGAGDRVVGRSRFCDWPAEAARVPVVGGYVGVDLEAVLGRAPDLVVGAFGPSSGRLAAQLDARSVRSWFPELSSCRAIAAMVEGMGGRTANAEAARAIVARMRSELDGIRDAVAHLPAPRVLFVLQLEPVVVAGPASFVDELIGRSRAVNVVTSGPAWQALEAEQLVELRPDRVLDATEDPGGARRIDPEAPGWRSIAAVREGRVSGVNDSRVLRPGPRVAEGLAILARAIHPDAVLPHA